MDLSPTKEKKVDSPTAQLVEHSKLNWKSGCSIPGWVSILFHWLNARSHVDGDCECVNRMSIGLFAIAVCERALRVHSPERVTLRLIVRVELKWV